MAHPASTMAPAPGASKVGRKRAEPDTSTYQGLFALRLFSLMTKAGIDAGELAKRCGVTRRAVDHWLSGRRTPAVEKLPEIAAALGVSSPRNVLPQ